MYRPLAFFFVLVFLTRCEYDGPGLAEPGNGEVAKETFSPTMSCKVNGENFSPAKGMEGFYWRPRGAHTNALQFTFRGKNGSELFLLFYDSSKCETVPFTLDILPWPFIFNDTMDYAKCEWSPSHAAGSSYVPYPGSSVTVTHWDREQKRISGTFAVKLKNCETGGDTIHITEGKFDDLLYTHGWPVP